MTAPDPATPRGAFSIAEFCKCYGICRATFYNEVKRGNLRAVKLRGRTLVLREDATEWTRNLPSLVGYLVGKTKATGKVQQDQ